MAKFKSKYPKVQRAEITGTNYSIYYLPPGTKDADLEAEFRYGRIMRSDDPNTCYQHPADSDQYGNLATGLISFVHNYMTNMQGLHEVQVPEAKTLAGQQKPKATCPVFMSREFYWPDETQRKANASKTALVLIQGTGAVRAGLWARSVCINDGLRLGTMLPQVDWANSKNIPVIVMNPNHRETDGIMIPQFSSMDKHCNFIWQHYVEPAGFGKLLVIAHSAGGGCVTQLIHEFGKSFTSKVKHLAYTDSWVSAPGNAEFLANHAVHYIASKEPLDTQLKQASCLEVSAGHIKHEYTTGTAWPLIMKQFE